ncbi:hypothetical protein [Thiomonas sp.]
MTTITPRSTWFVKDLRRGTFRLTATGRTELQPFVRELGWDPRRALTVEDLEELLAQHWLAHCSPEMRKVVDGDF